MKRNKIFKDFISNEKSAGLILIFCTAISLVLANCLISQQYIHLWHTTVLSKSIEFWINDGLMTIFFLFVGLEIKREIFVGELSDIKKATLPVIAAIGGMLIPALIHFIFNKGTATQIGFGIPMATDIAFSLAILSLLGNRVPNSLKTFLIALAIMDDLGAIIVIALFYANSFSTLYFGFAMLLLAIMLILNRFKVYRTWAYLSIGMLMWYFMYKSGIHATITGVLIAFVIPFDKSVQNTALNKLQQKLNLPVAYIILPLFALANTAIPIPFSILNNLSSPNSYGIIFGLLIGKPLGIFLFSVFGVLIGICAIPENLKKYHLLFVGLLAGMGFTMSIFITVLAYTDPVIITSSKIAIMVGSAAAGALGYIGLRLTLK